MSTKKSTKKSTSQYVLVHVNDDMRTHTLNLEGDNIFEAVKSFEKFIRAMLKKNNETLKPTSVLSMTIMPKPKAGRPRKDTKETDNGQVASA